MEKSFVVNAGSLAIVADVCALTAGRGTIPAYRKMLIEVNEDHVTLASTNGHIQVRVKTECQATEAFGFVVETMDFINAVKTTKSKIKCTLKDKRVVIKSPTGRYIVSYMDADDFPLLDFLHEDDAAQVNVDFTAMAIAVKKAAVGSEADELRPGFESVLVDIKKDHIKAVGLSYSKMVIAHVNDDTISSGEMSFLLPPQTHRFIENIMAIGDVTVSKKGSYVIMTNDDISMSFVQSVNEFPPYTKLLELDFTQAFSVNIDALMSAIRRITPFGSKVSNAVEMKFSGNKCVITAQDIDFGRSGMEEIHIDGDVSDTTILVSSRYLMEILSVHRTDVVEIKVQNTFNPILITSLQDDDNKDGCLTLLMTMRDASN